MFSPSERESILVYGLRVIIDLSIVDIWMDDTHAGAIRKNVTKNSRLIAAGEQAGRLISTELNLLLSDQYLGALRCSPDPL